MTAGMGGSTGTGAAPVVAKVAKEQGATVIAIVSTPLRVTRSRMLRANAGVAALTAIADMVIQVDSNRMLEFAPNSQLEQLYSITDQTIAETMRVISEAIIRPSLMNIDYDSLKTILIPGEVVLLLGEAKGEKRLRDVVPAAMNHPLLDIDYRWANGMLIHVAGGPDMTLHEAEEIVKSLR